MRGSARNGEISLLAEFIPDVRVADSLTAQRIFEGKMGTSSFLSWKQKRYLLGRALWVAASRHQYESPGGLGVPINLVYAKRR